ncbi:Ran-binding-domain-containing protein [Dissoconium aciculare CBS 342.82]|uniref:Ran-binding-domain-containing protein n=1 Tax=Dissoconium aciculare CBS 342.82 TaxID=1314786 RepID=A0A6J3M6E2_9PEZI|nr:Ran-binding-domain-containing protein [Dissoconium aciculare CBS 342.82]KAF1823468.1 Ran-binding-domain-containing protein [Dissoconium aciculare CBS 342.82]
MDVLLTRITQQAVQYAIRSGVSISAGFAIQQCHRLLKATPKGKEREQLVHLQIQLESKIRVISPSIDMIELIVARGNTSLESVVSLTRDIRLHIQRLGTRLSHMAYTDANEGGKHTTTYGSRVVESSVDQLRSIVLEMETLLHRIEDVVPLINLAITTSGVSMSTKLTEKISPSRLLQASAFVTAADRAYISDAFDRVQVGPTYILSLYMLFSAHPSRPKDSKDGRRSTWKEVMHKAHVKIWRVPLSKVYALPGHDAGTTIDITDHSIPAEAKTAEYAYQLSIVEDLDDDRVHTLDDYDARPGAFDDITNAGYRDVIPVHEISKIFFADTGKLLNIRMDEENNNPVILLKRDVHAELPRRLLDRSRSLDSLFRDCELEDLVSDAKPNSGGQIPTTHRDSRTHSGSDWRLPADLDPEWMAFEVYAEDSSDSSSETSKIEQTRSQTGDLDNDGSNRVMPIPLHAISHYPPIKTTLSLLEVLLKLLALQQFRQESHLAIEDELLNFFLETSSTAESGLSQEHVQKLRSDAVHHVGFDPYDQSPTRPNHKEFFSVALREDSPVGISSTHASRASPESAPGMSVGTLSDLGGIRMNPESCHTEATSRTCSDILPSLDGTRGVGAEGSTPYHRARLEFAKSR